MPSLPPPLCPASVARGGEGGGPHQETATNFGPDSRVPLPAPFVTVQQTRMP